MATGDRKDPYRSFNFRVEIDGIAVGSFSEVSGLSSDGDVVEYRNGDDVPLHVRKLIGLCKFSNITLKRGYTQNRELWNWRKNIVNGIADRRDGSVVLMDEERNDVLRWNFTGGWIHKIDGPSFNAKGNEVGIESLEIVVESLSLADQ
jgi:phage tail-like protein